MTNQCAVQCFIFPRQVYYHNTDHGGEVTLNGLNATQTSNQFRAHTRAEASPNRSITCSLEQVAAKRDIYDFNQCVRPEVSEISGGEAKQKKA